jgi:hypothetical protein
MMRLVALVPGMWLAGVLTAVLRARQGRHA